VTPPGVVATLRGWTRRIRSALTGGRPDDDLERELALHLEIAEDELRRRGHEPAEARRLARIRHGLPDLALETLRDQRGLPTVASALLDIKLGARMMRRSWGLSLVVGVAMTVVILIAAGSFTALRVLSGASLPLDGGDRVVALQPVDPTAHRVRPASYVEFDRWRRALRSIDDLGAFRSVRRVLGDAGGGEPLEVAEMTASGFTLARVPPLFGRPLVEDDERPTASPVVVLGFDLWRARFEGDPAAVGRRVEIGGVSHTVVGVMPETFRFPVNHNLWVPLRAPGAGDGRQRPTLFVFGRLAPGVTLDAAQSSLDGAAPFDDASAASPPENVGIRVVPYTQGFVHLEPLWADLLLILVTVLLLPPCANVAILMYARTVTRQREFAARHALGASRGRIVGQLFIESMVLTSCAAGLALLLHGFTFARTTVTVSQSPGATPFWMDFSLSPGTMIYVAGIVLLAAGIAGAVPAFQATGRLFQSGLRTMHGGATMPLGPTWTCLVVGQIAVAVAVLPPAAELAWGLLRPGVLGPGFAAEDFVTARIDMEGGAKARLLRALREDGELSAATMASAQPGGDGGDWALIEIAAGDAPGSGVGGAVPGGVHEVESARVAPGFFEVLDVPLRGGRRFTSGDTTGGLGVIVNSTFAREVLGGANPLGHRIRYRRLRSGATPATEPWREIVGVVDDRPANRNSPVVYQPAGLDAMSPSYLLVRTGRGAGFIERRLREAATALDPQARVDEVRRLDEVYLARDGRGAAGALGLAVGTIAVLLLSSAGLYALMSFTVSQRRREIGIRSALGAQPRRLLATVFRRALAQIAVGVGIGCAATVTLARWLPIEDLGGWPVPGALPAAVVLFLVLGVLASLGPARRGLRVDPMDALREG
jgi:predicted permease